MRPLLTIVTIALGFFIAWLINPAPEPIMGGHELQMLAAVPRDHGSGVTLTCMTMMTTDGGRSGMPVYTPCQSGSSVLTVAGGGGGGSR